MLCCYNVWFDDGVDNLLSLSDEIFSIQRCGFLKRAKSNCILAGQHHGSDVCSHGGLKVRYTYTEYLAKETLHEWYACNLRFHFGYYFELILGCCSFTHLTPNTYIHAMMIIIHVYQFYDRDLATPVSWRGSLTRVVVAAMAGARFCC